MDKNKWLDGIMGVVVGDALGNPVQFMGREEISNRPHGPVTGMEPGGAYNTPAGTWTDDSSMTLATLDSIRQMGGIDPEDIMTGFVNWYEDGEYTPFGEAFDMGNTCSEAIERYESDHDVLTCGLTGGRSNGNGSLMRIMPVCLYACDRELPAEEAVDIVRKASSLTHAHLRSQIGCGLYYYCVRNLVSGEGDVKDRLQKAMDAAFDHFGKDIETKAELEHYHRLRDLNGFADLPAEKIKSTGYVLDTLEAAVWCLITTDTLEECLLKAVNLGDDADTVGAVAGGLAGLYYGYDSIPKDWLDTIARREWIEEMCSDMAQ